MKNDIHLPPIEFKMFCDASNTGWGAKFQDSRAGGSWVEDELPLHINVKELLAVYFALRVFSCDLAGSHVLVFSDNTTTVAVINNMGTSRSHKCNELAKTIWGFCRSHSIWLTAAHIPGVDNIDADYESRRDYRDSDWMLNPKVFRDACLMCDFTPDIDCFANRMNSQLPRYVSFRPDPYAEYVDAFSLNWAWFNPYLFPPFSIIGQVLQKIQVDKADVLMVVPKWPTKPWYNTFVNLLQSEPLVVMPSVDNLILPAKPGEVHPLAGKLTLLVGRLSGRSSSVKDLMPLL